MLALAVAVNLAVVHPAFAEEGAAGGSDMVEAGQIAWSHGFAMHGDPKYGPEFQHLDYVNPEAPKGGTLTLAQIGGFDSLNPFVRKGEAATGLGLIYDTLMASTDDEAFSEYGLLAEAIRFPEDRSWVEFRLREEARWHDGQPVTPEDVIFSFTFLTEKGAPFYRAYYGNVKAAEKVDDRTVRFTFDVAGNRELPLIMGQMTILPKHFWDVEGRDPAGAGLELKPMGSGPYRIAKVDAPNGITYERVADYWGNDLPINRGRWNFGKITYQTYTDASVAREALFAGEYDFRAENIAKDWATAYDAPQVTNGEITKAEIPHDRPTGMQAFVFNTRRDIFKDPAVRRAIGLAFDFEWSNKQFAYGSYTRTQSFFSNSELAATGLPSEAELAILKPLAAQFPDHVPPAVFTEEYVAPATDGSGNNRRNLREATRLLKQAGYEIVDGKRVGPNGKPLDFEILLVSPSFERWVQPFRDSLKKLGITMSIRIVDPAQYGNRIDSYDFDMVIGTFGQSLSPGNEQRDFWGSEKAAENGSRNIIGVQNPAIDAAIERLILAENREDLIVATKALDRLLLHSHFVIPQWHIDRFRVAYWDRFGQPQTRPRYALGVLDTWWEASPR
ncbi:MAG: extracellular solute-binding protein [Alphaproteobacteria bacterium]